MTSNKNEEYLYEAATLSHAHAYILPQLDAALQGLPENARLIDVGCGNGSVTSHLAQRFPAAQGIDFSRPGVELAKLHFPKLHFEQGDVCGDLSALAGQFDVAVSLEVVEHLFSPRPFAANCFQLLKPGGVLVISTPYHGYLKNLVLAVTGKMDRHFTALWDCGHIKFWSEKTLTALLAEAGFTNFEFRGCGRFPFLWMSMLLTCRKPLA